MSTDVTSPGPRGEVVEGWVRNAQFNADLADARFAQSASLCIYLLDMREYFRWKKGFGLDQTLKKDELGPWIARKEDAWEQLRDQYAEHGGYRPLEARQGDDPFNTEGLSVPLTDARLVYGAGVGRFGRPLFFLAEQLRSETRGDLQVLVSGRELARGSTSPPAMSRDRQILVRRDALVRWLWTRFEEWRHHPRDNGFAVAWHCFDSVHGPVAHPDPAAVVEAIADQEIESLILHEIGERRADARLGDVWQDMVDDIEDRKIELFVRALRDLLADCSYTLPMQFERGATASWNLWFGLLDGMRLKLAPGLAEFYRGSAGERSASLEHYVDESSRHWQSACLQAIERWRAGGEDELRTMFDQDAVVR